MKEMLTGLYYMIMKMEKCWDLMHYCVLLHRGIPLLLHDSTNAYATRQGNDLYIYHNALVTVVIPNGCPPSTTTKECSPDQKGAQQVCKLTGGSMLARMDYG